MLGVAIGRVGVVGRLCWRGEGGGEGRGSGRVAAWSWRCRSRESERCSRDCVVQWVL